MPLDTNDITNLERGIDAAIDTVLDMARESMVKINKDYGSERAGPFVGFVQAVVEHRAALANKCLMDAMAHHPDLDESDVGLETEGKTDA